VTEQDRHRAIHGKIAGMGGTCERRSSTPISTSWPELDAALGIGGLPRGSIVEIFGPSGSGKTTVALRIVAFLQNLGGAAGWIDAEHAFDPRYAAGVGVAIDRLPLVRPASAEQAFEIARRLLASSALDLLVIDSAAALVPELELRAALGAGGAGLQSRVLASGLRSLAHAVAKSDTSVLFLNQTRSRPGIGCSAETTAGGPSLKLHAEVRIALEPAGPDRFRFRVLKNKSADAFRQGELRLHGGPGTQECP
jgi:recombination protein RecA